MQAKSALLAMSGPEARNTTERNVPGKNRVTAGSTLEKVVQLERRLVSLERERSAQLYSRRHEFHRVFCTLEEMELKLNQNRKTEKKELSQQISRIRGNVQSFQKMLSDMKPGPAFVERLRQVLEETEASLLAFKDKQRDVYESLLVEERQANQEVMSFHKRMEAWPSSGGEHPPTTTAATAAERGMRRAESGATMPPAVLAFERFLEQTGGTRGGWEDYDHNTFLQIRTKHTGEAVFLEEALRQLPTHTESDIKAHCAWYTEYCTLLEAKRLAIQQWRKNRQVVHSEQLKLSSVEDNDCNNARKKRLAANNEQERQLNKEKLQAWKVQRELYRQEAEEQRQRENEKMAKKREREKIRQAEVSVQVRQYQGSRERKRQAATVEEQRRLKDERREQQLVATHEIEWFRERDMRAVAEKRERTKEKELAKIKKKECLDKLKQQVEVSVERDPDRLFRLTTGWEERKKASEEEGCQRVASIGISSRELPKRAVPAWRQGL